MNGFKTSIFPLSRILGLAISLIALTGCHSFGPDYLTGTHPLYNSAILSSMNDQFLLNLVRLHYREPTYFLDVASVAASANLNMNGTFGLDVNPTSESGNIGGGMAYQTVPTISYAPLQGEDFVKSLLSPLSLDSLLALTGSGWKGKRVFGLCVESANGVLNAPSASGPTPMYAPKQMGEWHRLADLLDELAEVNLIAARQQADSKGLKMEMRRNPEYADAARELKDILHLDPRLDVFDIEGDSIEHRSDRLQIVTRPLMGVFFYLSHLVDSPPEHEAEGLVTVTKNPDGSRFDWGSTPAGRLFRIRYSDYRPDNAFLAVPYMDHWFYIANNDLETKSTFLLLTQLFRLQAGAAKSIGPTLTIPVR